MTVAELIAILQKMPPDNDAVIMGMPDDGDAEYEIKACEEWDGVTMLAFDKNDPNPVLPSAPTRKMKAPDLVPAQPIAEILAKRDLAEKTIEVCKTTQWKVVLEAHKLMDQAIAAYEELMSDDSDRQG